MFQNLETNRPNTHAKFELDWFSGFLKKRLHGSHGFVDLLLGFSWSEATFRLFLCFPSERNCSNNEDKCLLSNYV